MNITATLVDLFDGSNTPNQLPNFTATDTRQFSDAPTWRVGRTDDASLTFQQICQPLIDNRPSDKISFPFISTKVVQNVYEYADALIGVVDCADRPEVKEVFNENEISDFNGGDLVNSDDIFAFRTISYPKVPYSRKPFGQYVLSKSADKLHLAECHCFLLACRFIIFVCEGHFAFFYLFYPMIANRYFMRVPA